MNMETERKIGNVKWFSNHRGYGFLECAESDNIFVHYNQIDTNAKYKTLDEGQAVEFELKKTDRGLAAIHVKPISAKQLE